MSYERNATNPFEYINNFSLYVALPIWWKSYQLDWIGLDESVIDINALKWLTISANNYRMEMLRRF